MNNKLKAILALVFVCVLTIGLVAYTQITKEPAKTSTELSVTNELIQLTQTPFAQKYIALLDSDLDLSIADGKMIFTSKEGFNYIKFNGQTAPKNASMVLGFFDLNALIVKHGNTVTVQRN
jgi:hypothetical protein